MQAFHAVLLEADTSIERKEMEVVSPEFAKRALAELVRLE